MANRIKGLTIEIGGNTTKLQTALKDVDSSLNKTQTALKDVNKLLKFDPHNTELLSQKQTLLKSAIEQTSNRLQTLKEAEKDAQKAFAEGKVSEEQYAALKREIAETEEKLKSLQKTQSGLANFGAGAKKLGGQITSAGKAIMPLSVGVAGLGIASGKMAIDFEDSMARINTLLDDDSHLESYENSIMDLSNETGISLDLMSDGMYQTISSIGDGGKETEAIFGTMAKAAKAGQSEVSDSVSLISAGMKGYGEVNDATAQKISDLAFETAKLGVTTFPEMATSMQPLFPLANSLNISLEELFASMATLTGVTGNTSEVTTQLKAVFTGLMKPTGAMEELIAKYGYSSGSAMLESEGLAGVLAILQTETGGQSDKLAELFGSTEALTAMTALTGAQFDTFGEKLGAMGEASGATEEAYDKLDTKGQQIRETMNLVKNSATELGAELMIALAPIIEDIAEGIKKLTEWFSGLSEKQKKLILIIGGIIAVAGPLLVIIGGIITAVGTIAGALSALSPMMLLIGGIIAAVVAAGVLLYQNWDKIKEKAAELGEWLSEKWEAIKECVVGVWEAIVTKISEVWETITTVIGVALSFIGELISTAVDIILLPWTFLWENCKEFLIGAWETIKTAVSTALSAISETISTVWNTIAGFIGPILERIKTTISTAWETVKTTVTTALTTVWTTITSIHESISTAISTAWETVKTTVSTAVESVRSTISEKLESAKATVSEILESISSKFSTIWEGAKEIVSGAIETIKGYFNFEWSLPKIKLPHFSINGEFSLNPPSHPTFDISWYAKAMDAVHMLDGAQLFGSMGGSLLGGGEAGTEMVVGKDYMMNLIKDAVGFNGVDVINAIVTQTTRLITAMERCAAMYGNIKIVIGDREFKRILADKGVVFK